jgi:hypothetical protein
MKKNNKCKKYLGNDHPAPPKNRNYKHYSAIDNSHTLQFATACTKPQSAVSSPVVAW